MIIFLLQKHFLDQGRPLTSGAQLHAVDMGDDQKDKVREIIADGHHNRLAQYRAACKANPKTRFYGDVF